MVKTLNVVFDDKEFKFLTDKKDLIELNWHDFLLNLVKYFDKVKK